MKHPVIFPQKLVSTDCISKHELNTNMSGNIIGISHVELSPINREKPAVLIFESNSPTHCPIDISTSVCQDARRRATAQTPQPQQPCIPPPSIAHTDESLSTSFPEAATAAIFASRGTELISGGSYLRWMSAVAVDVLFGALAVIASAVNMSVALLLGYAVLRSLGAIPRADLQAMGRRNPMAVGGVGGALFAAPLGLCVRTLVVWSPRTTDHAEDARTDHTQQSGSWKVLFMLLPCMVSFGAVAGPLGAVVLGIDECSNMSLDAGYAAACGPLGMLLLWFVVAAQTVVSRAYKDRNLGDQ